MNLEDQGNGSLYKWIAILGVAIVFASITAMGSIIGQHDTKQLQGLQLFLDQDAAPELKNAIDGFLLQSKKNTEYAFSWMVGTTVFGLSTAVFGALAWYIRIQRHVDTEIARLARSSLSKSS